ncbi:MAG: ATP-binding protein [Saprospiraceae bacterium]|nr:ATP-binding protein [Saprospiraceae bacterium]
MKILITGPESTGKSTLALLLADALDITYIPEIARSYLESRNGEYSPEDIETIARLNVESVKELGDSDFIHDTYLLNLKIWFEVKYGYCPQWIEEEWIKMPFDLVLLSYPDVEWSEDPLRESPNDRMGLFQRFKSELEAHNLPYIVINGTGSTRLENAIDIINKKLIS